MAYFKVSAPWMFSKQGGRVFIHCIVELSAVIDSLLHIAFAMLETLVNFLFFFGFAQCPFPLSFALQPREKGRMRFHRLQNVQIALDFLKQRQVNQSTIPNYFMFASESDIFPEVLLLTFNCRESVKFHKPIFYLTVAFSALCRVLTKCCCVRISGSQVSLLGIPHQHIFRFCHKRCTRCVDTICRLPFIRIWCSKWL